MDGDDAMGDQSYKQPYHSQQILMNFNNLVAEFPLGKPVIPIFGSGGLFGAQLLLEDKFNPQDREMVESVTTTIMDKLIKHTSPTELAMLGLKRLGNETVVISINELPVTVCLVEHFFGTQLYILERKAGGTIGSSAKPKVASTHCHPIPQVDFMTEEANMALQTYRKVVREEE